MKSSKPQESAPEQHSRFVETARALGCDEDKEKFEASLRKVVAHKPNKGAKDERGKNIRHRNGRKDAKDTD